MNTYIAYFDETGDDGIISRSSDLFILTSTCMSSDKWQFNYDTMKQCRSYLKDKYGFHVKQEMHIKSFLTDKNPYRDYHWSSEDRLNIIKTYLWYIGQLDISVVNTVIDKRNVIHTESYSVLEKALTYNIQRIENTSAGNWNYILISDKGRIGAMRKTARALRRFNPIPQFDNSFVNMPIKYMVEDILEKDSADSHFIQVSDFISYFVNLYYKSFIYKEPLPNRVARLIDKDFIEKTMDYLRDRKLLNLAANRGDQYGLVIYPKK